MSAKRKSNCEEDKNFFNVMIYIHNICKATTLSFKLLSDQVLPNWEKKVKKKQHKKQ